MGLLWQKGKYNLQLFFVYAAAVVAEVCYYSRAVPYSAFWPLARVLEAGCKLRAVVQTASQATQKLWFSDKSLLKYAWLSPEGYYIIN